MKKKWFQRGLCAVLSATLALGLTACGGKGKGVSQDPSLAKQYVYSYREIGEFANLGDDIYIQDITRKDDKIYFLMEVYHYSVSGYDSGGSEQDIRLVSMNDDGTEVKMEKIEQNLTKPEWEIPEENNGENGGASDGNSGIMPLARVSARRPAVMEAVVSSADTSVPSDTEPAETENQEGDADGTEDAEQTEDSMSKPEIYPSTYEYLRYQNFTFSSDAKLFYGIRQYRREDYTDPYNPITNIHRMLCAWDMKGKIEWEQDLAEFIDSQEEYWVNTMTSLEDGSLMMIFEGEKSFKMIVDKKGKLVESEEFNNVDENLDRLSSVIKKDDGTAYALYWDQDWRYQYIAPYDLETGKLGEGQKLPEMLNRMGHDGMSAGKNTDLVFSTNSGVFTYNIGDEELTQIMSYVNSDLYANGLNRIIMMDNDNFVGFYYDMEDYTTRVAYFTKVDPKDIPDKKVILVAAFYVPYNTRKRIVEFNKTSEEYRIVYKEYESYATEDDYMAGYTQLNNDIISGNMPDILVCNSSMPVENYVSKGLLADVEKLIAKDEELSKAKFIQNVFDAYKVDGKLYYVIPSFQVRSFMGKKSVLGDRTSWTMEEFRDIMDSRPEGTLGFGEITRESFIYTMMTYCGSDFVDVSTGKCKFDSQNFIDMLEYANTLPTELDYEKWDDDYWMNYGSQWREDRTLLAEVYLSNMQDLNRSMKGSFGEEVSFVGFPTDSGKGSVITVNDFYAISSKSANQEGAWQFLRYYLTEEYQDDMGWQIPTNRASYEKWLAAAMEKPYYEDENGNKIEYENTYYINGEEIVIPVMTKEETEHISAFIESVDKRAYMNTNIQNIITEEVAAFFEGQKSAQAVAEIIQSRVKVYVNENR